MEINIFGFDICHFLTEFAWDIKIYRQLNNCENDCFQYFTTKFTCLKRWKSKKDTLWSWSSSLKRIRFNRGGRYLGLGRAFQREIQFFFRGFAFLFNKMKKKVTEIRRKRGKHLLSEKDARFKVEFSEYSFLQEIRK